LESVETDDAGQYQLWYWSGGKEGLKCRWSQEIVARRFSGQQQEAGLK